MQRVELSQRLFTTYFTTYNSTVQYNNSSMAKCVPLRLLLSRVESHIPRKLTFGLASSDEDGQQTVVI